MRVLVCDDDPAARFVAKRWVTSALGCTVVDCEDGVEALELLSAQSFDLALIDLDLPRLNGVEVVEAIRANAQTHDLPVVILSQERREDVVRTLLALGVSAYLLKPLRERTVLGRIGPILAARRASRPVSARSMSDVRLGPDSPAMVVDGDANFRHTFTQVAGQFGPVMAAESGADALALYRRSPVGLMFIGTGLGIMGAETLIKKIRDVEASTTRLIALGAQSDTAGPLFDAHLARAFVTDTLVAELKPYVRIAGPLSALDEYAPQFAGCLDSAVVQVFGMMGGLDAAAAGDGEPTAWPAATASVTVDIQATFQLDLELVLPTPVATDVSQRLLGCEPADVDEEAMLATAGELMNMVSGRLDAWLKGRHLGSRVTLPVPRLAADADGSFAVTPGDGFAHRFTVGEHADALVLRARARQPVAA